MNIFAPTMILRIQTLLLAFVLMMPVIISSVTLGKYAEHQIEFCDNPPEEEQEERETEKEREKEGVEEYVLRHQIQMGLFCGPNSNYSSVNDLLASVSGDVLTPPPEYI